MAAYLPSRRLLQRAALSGAAQPPRLQTPTLMGSDSKLITAMAAMRRRHRAITTSHGNITSRAGCTATRTEIRRYLFPTDLSVARGRCISFGDWSPRTQVPRGVISRHRAVALAPHLPIYRRPYRQAKLTTQCGRMVIAHLFGSAMTLGRNLNFVSFHWLTSSVSGGIGSKSIQNSAGLGWIWQWSSMS